MAGYRTLLQRRQVRELAPRPPRILVPGRAFMPSQLPGLPRQVIKTLPLFGFIYYTYNKTDPTDWSTSTMVSSTVLKGWLWQVWNDALEARILSRGGTIADELIVTDTTLQFKGRVIFDLCSMVDVIVLGHFPPAEHIAEIKRLSTAPNGTKCLVGFNNFESINQAATWQPRFEGLRQHQRQYWITADRNSGCPAVPPDFELPDGTNSYGATSIDQFEIIDSGAADLCTAEDFFYPPDVISQAPVDAVDPATKHSWDIDIYVATNNGSLTSGHVNTMLGILAAVADAVPASGGYGPRPWVVDGFLWDNLKSNPFKGTSTTDYPAGYSTNYESGWKAFLSVWNTYFDSGAGAAAFSDVGLSLWCNYGSGVNSYSRAEIGNRFSEHAFKADDGSNPVLWVDLEARLILQADNGHRVVLGAIGTHANTHFWHTTTGGPNPSTNGTWAQIIAKVRSLGIEDLVYAQAFRTSAGAYLAYQEGWREPS